MKSILTAALVLVSACAPSRSFLPAGGDTTDAGTAEDAGNSQDAGPGADGGGNQDGGSFSPTGGPCQSNRDCGALSNDTFCLTETQANASGLNAPGGYCTVSGCNSANPGPQCGIATTCGALGSSDGGLFCEAACGSTADCRTGYTCEAGGCIPTATTCPLGKLACDGACVDPAVDPLNCGGCGNVCSGGLCGTSIDAPMSETPTDWAFNGGAAFASGADRASVVADRAAVQGSVVYGHPILADDFTVTFEFSIGGTDGMGFMLETDGPNVAANGTDGSLLGMAGLNGWGVEFDLFNNGNSTACGETASTQVGLDSLAICNGSLPTTLSGTSDLTSLSPPIHLGNGSAHWARIDWAGPAVSVQVDGHAVLSASLGSAFQAGAPRYFGFASANGASHGETALWGVQLSFPSPHCLAEPASPWHLLPGVQATDVALGSNGLLWIIDTTPSESGFGISTLDLATGEKTPRPGSAVRIDTASGSDPWAVTSSGDLFRWDANAWSKVTAPAATDISIGADGTVWMIDNQTIGGNHGIQRYNGSGWDMLTGGALRVDVDPQGHPWVTNDTETIYHFNGSGWDLVNGLATDIGVAANGSTFVLGTGGQVFKWNGAGWTPRGGSNFVALAAGGPLGIPVAVDANHNVWVGEP